MFASSAIVNAIVLFFISLFICALGIGPALWRLGNGLATRKVGIVGSADAYLSLKGTLIDSGLFWDKNVSQVPLDNFEKVKDFTVVLVDWGSCASSVEEIFGARKNQQTAIIIHAKPGEIPKEIMDDIANRPNTVVVNFRGRLLNDILTSLMTTSYEKK